MVKVYNRYRCCLVREAEVPYETRVHTAKDVEQILLKEGFADAAEEFFSIVCLDCKGNVLGYHEISHGSVNSAFVHPREVFKRALLNNAANIILAHSHPSGNAEPSTTDVQMTERLCEAGELLGVKVIDHLIVGFGGTVFSMKENNLM